MGLNLHEVVGSFPISQALLSVSPSSSEKIPMPDHPLFFGTLGGCLIILFPSGYTCPRFYMRMLPSVGGAGWGGDGGAICLLVTAAFTLVALVSVNEKCTRLATFMLWIVFPDCFQKNRRLFSPLQCVFAVLCCEGRTILWPRDSSVRGSYKLQSPDNSLLVWSFL